MRSNFEYDYPRIKHYIPWHHLKRKKMETSKIKNSILAVSAMLLSVSFMQAQTDTTRMGTDTSGIRSNEEREMEMEDRTIDEEMGTDTTGIRSGTETETERESRTMDTETPDVDVENETNVYDVDRNTPVTSPYEDDSRVRGGRNWWHDDDFHPGELGLRYMPTFSKIEVDRYGGDIVQGEVTASNGVELIAGINFNRHIGIMAGIGYNEFQQKYKDRGLDRRVDVSYINIPVMLQLNTSKSAPVNFNLVVGPQFGINVGADADEDNGTASATVAVKGGDVGLAYGAGLEFGLTPDRMLRLDLGFRGMLGFTDVSDKASGDTYTITVKGARQAYGGYVGLAWAF